MAGMCCGIIGEAETSPAPSPVSVLKVEPAGRTARRRRMEIRKLKIVSETADTLPEIGIKRQKLEVVRSPSPRRECESGSENCSPVPESEVTDNDESDESSQMEEDCDRRPTFGATSVRGRRRDMEDTVSIRPSFCGYDDSNSSGFDFYGVFDGHGCSHVAAMCKERMHAIVKEEVDCVARSREWKRVMERSFLRMDEEVTEKANCNGASCRCELQTPQCDAVGSTAVVAVVTPEEIVISNCGDSRAVLCRNGVAIPLSTDHKPDRPDELDRIEAAGGRVIYWDGPRVLGVLAMSRAIGDNYLKPYVMPEPEVTVIDRTADEDCLILASDGLWDVVSNETAATVAKMCLTAARPPSPPRSPGNDVNVSDSDESSNKACLEASLLLTKLALARHSADNVSVIVVDLRRNR